MRYRNSKHTKLLRFFLLSAAILLFCTALAKIISSFGSDRVLETQETIFAITYRNIFRLFGTLELGVAIYCLFSKRIVVKAGLLAWLATGFAVYRASMSWVGYIKPCPCLGSLTKELHVSPQVADSAMKAVLVYLLIGSYASLLWLWMQSRQTRITATTSVGGTESHG